MTIAEEIDKKSGRKHRSGTITEAMRYAFGIEHMPTSIADAVAKANFNPPDEFTITWMNGETKLGEDIVEYGEAPSYTGGTPTKTGYTFLGWNTDSAAATALAELPVVTGNTTYYAIFEINTYDITWKNGETTLDTDTVNYGVTPAYTGETPTKQGHIFVGWNSDSTAEVALENLPVATADATYYAIFEANTDCDCEIHSDLGTIYYCGGLQNGDIINTGTGTHDAGAIVTDPILWNGAIRWSGLDNKHMYLVSKGNIVEETHISEEYLKFGDVYLSYITDAETGFSRVEVSNAPSHYAIYSQYDPITT